MRKLVLLFVLVGIGVAIAAAATFGARGTSIHRRSRHDLGRRALRHGTRTP